MTKRIIKYLIIVLIFNFAAFLRFYKLDQIPPSLNWDETAAGYNAYTIANWGADEYGNKFPIVFKSFADDKHPVHIYITAMIVKIFGLSDFNVRAGSAIVGTLTVISIFFLAKKLFKSDLAGILSALFLTVSPYHLQFSRGLWENNFALFFCILGLTLFYYGLSKKQFLIPLSVASFGLSFFSYHSSKVVIPVIVIFLLATNYKQIFRDKKIVIASILIALLFGALIIKDPRILGFARVNQTKFSEDVIKNNGGLIQTYINNYKKYFTYSYLFKIGDQGPRASVKIIGEFYKIDLLLSLFGILSIFLKRNWKVFSLIAVWLLISPIPGALSSTDPSAIRGIFMIGPIILLSGCGAAFVISFSKKYFVKVIMLALIILTLFFEAKTYFAYYYTKYSYNEAIEWQYGMKQIVEYLKSNPNYAYVYMDKIRQQPYIFFLYYLKTPLPELLKSVKYDQSDSKSYNTVVNFGKYQFGGNWNIINSYPNFGVLYIVTPSYYGGLYYKTQFTVKDLIKYPNGTDAFYIVEGDK